jgi:hypothetical protein
LTICSPAWSGGSQQCPSDMSPCIRGSHTVVDGSASGLTGACKDEFSAKKCARKQRKGKCQRRPKRMARKCKATCGFCV